MITIQSCYELILQRLKHISFRWLSKLCFMLIAMLSACTGTSPFTAEPAVDSISESGVVFGELQKDGGFYSGAPLTETIRVYNCGNPLPRSLIVRESKGVENSIQWEIEGELGLSGSARPIGIGGEIEGKIAAGYAREVTEQLQRGQEFPLPVQADSSVEYTVEWETLVWSGTLPFSLHSVEDRILYLYSLHLFGEVVDFKDRTMEDCGHPPLATSEALPIVPTEQEEVVDPGLSIEATPSQPEPAPKLSKPIPTQEPPSIPDAQTISRFEVQSKVMKNRTNLSISTGDIIHVEYLDGAWTGNSFAAGTTNGCGYRWDDPDPNHVWLFPPEQRGAALVGYIDGTPFFVGCQPVDIVAPTSGELYFGMSECQECYWDNEGSLFVLVSVRRP